MKKQLLLEKGIKIIIGILSCAFLFYTLLHFDGYRDLPQLLNNADFYRWNGLALAILLVPFNWYLEAVKWQTLLAKLEHLSLPRAFRSVLVGLTTGAFSPWRLGEFAGRVLLLAPENRKKASLIWGIGSVTMTISILLLGIPAFYLFLKSGKPVYLLKDISINNYLIITLLLAVFLLIIYFVTPFFKGFQQLSVRQLLDVLGISLFRYVIFCVQCWLMFHFFGIELSLKEACTGIFTAYLFITFLPSFFATEAVVKSSVFVLIISAFAKNTVAIACASMSLWILNLAIPTFLGVYLLMRKTNKIATFEENLQDQHK